MDTELAELLAILDNFTDVANSTSNPMRLVRSHNVSGKG